VAEVQAHQPRRPLTAIRGRARCSAPPVPHHHRQHALDALQRQAQARINPPLPPAPGLAADAGPQCGRAPRSVWRRCQPPPAGRGLVAGQHPRRQGRGRSLGPAPMAAQQGCPGGRGGSDRAEAAAGALPAVGQQAFIASSTVAAPFHPAGPAPSCQPQGNSSYTQKRSACARARNPWYRIRRGQGLAGVLELLTNRPWAVSSFSHDAAGSSHWEKTSSTHDLYGFGEGLEASQTVLHCPLPVLSGSCEGQRGLGPLPQIHWGAVGLHC
jgi:hypothetical protein